MIYSHKPFRTCATPRNPYAKKLAAIKAWLGTDYVLHPEYNKKQRLDVRQRTPEQRVHFMSGSLLWKRWV